MNTNNPVKPLLIDSLPEYCTDIYHDDLRCVDIAHVVNVDSIDDITGDTAGIKLYDTQGKPQSVVIYPKGRKPYQHPYIQGVAMVYGDLSDPIHAVLGLDNAQALYTDLQATSKGGAVVSLPDSLETSFKAVLDAFKPICVYTTHDKPITYHHGDVVSHFAPLSMALANQTLAEMMASDDITVTQGNVWGELALIENQILEAVAGIAKLSDIQQIIAIGKTAKAFNIPKDKLTALVNERVQGDFIPEISPYHEAVSGQMVFDELYGLVDDYIYIDEPLKIAFVLWVVMTYLTDIAEILPIAWITAPEKACGKSTFLGLFARVVNKPYESVNPSQAVFYRIVERYRPTLLLDEIDNYLKDNKELLTVINAGYSLTACKVARVNMDKGGAIDSYGVFGARVFSGIGNMAGTFASRSIRFEMKRKGRDDKTKRLNHRTLPKARTDELQRKIKRWAMDNRQAVQNTDIAQIDVKDRDFDNWYILLQIARVLGVYDKALQACLSICQGEHEPSQNEQLLSDIRDVWHGTKMSSKLLLERLTADDDKVWATFNNGQPMTAYQFAKKLKSFDIKSQNMRQGTNVIKGFDKAQFTPVWERYLSPQTPSEDPFSLPEMS